MAHALYMLLLFFFVTQISQMTQIFLRGIIFVPQIYTDIHRFFSSEGFSSDFTDESEGILAYRITHGFSRIFGRWPMARARYVLLLFFVTQISQMTQIFLRGIIFVPQIYTDIHRFFSSEGFSSDFTDESEGILAYRITHGFSQIFGRWPMAGARYVLLCFWSRRFRR